MSGEPLSLFHYDDTLLLLGILHVSLILELGRILGTGKMHFNPPPVALAAVRSKVMASMLSVIPIVGIRNFCMFCCTLLCVHSSFEII